MQVLLVTDQPSQHEQVMIAYLRAGFQITATSSVNVAETFIRCSAIDLLILAESLDSKLTHSLALLAEHQNPLLATILLTDRTGEAAEEVFDLIPSVHCAVGSTVAGKTILQLGRASIESLAGQGMAFSFQRHSKSAGGRVATGGADSTLEMADAA